MQLKKLDYSFYTENSHLVEALDLDNGVWKSGKTRGYGVVVISLNNLTFGIPLRSNIRHGECYITVRNHVAGIKGKGLDFSKALLLLKTSYVSSEPFRIPDNEHEKLRGKAVFITEKFAKYVHRYVQALRSGDAHILAEYRYSTLQNYHAELLEEPDTI